MNHRRALAVINVSPAFYVRRRLLPITVASAVLAAAVVFGARGLLSDPVRWGVALALLLGGVGYALAYPVTRADRKKAEINQAMPFFMTHFGVLGTTNLSRTTIFRILGEKKDYKSLGEELLRIHSLVENWNMSLPDACRFVSRRTPSQLFADFLERLAHAFESGQDLSVFVRNEQSVVMKDYATLYRESVYQVEHWKDIYVSVIMSTVFFLIFALIMPILVGGDPVAMVYGGFALWIFAETLLFAVLRLRVPKDRLWHRLEIPNEDWRRLGRFLRLAVAACVAIGVGLVLVAHQPPSVAFVLAISPLFALGLYARRAENQIRRREDNYPAFIRSVGATIAARGGSIHEVIRRVKGHNFGPLNRMVENLYARLTWRIDDTLAWRHFSSESGGQLTASFNNMFVEGVRSGGRADVVGEIISNNMIEMLNLRKARSSTAGTFRGLLMGLTASIAFVLFLGAGILDVLGTIFSHAQAGGTSLGALGIGFDINTVYVGQILLWIVLYHALFAAAMLKVVDGGSLYAGTHYFVIMVWLAVGLQWITHLAMPQIFGALG